LAAVAAQAFFDFCVHGVVCLRHKPFGALNIPRELTDKPLGEFGVGGAVIEPSLNVGVRRIGSVRALALPGTAVEYRVSGGVDIVGLILTELAALFFRLCEILQICFGVLGPHKRWKQCRSEQALRPRVITAQRNCRTWQRLGLGEHLPKLAGLAFIPLGPGLARPCYYRHNVYRGIPHASSRAFPAALRRSVK